VELCALQDWFKHKGLRVVVVFEGRDAAGKGGAIKAIAERVSPRVFRVVALPAPSDREKGQLYLQRYVAHLPTAGEIVIFDRSWYNRAGVERVMGFCTDEQYHRFLKVCSEFELFIVDGGILLLKYRLEVSDEEQKHCFTARIEDPLRQWKLSPMNLCSRSKWFDYSRACDAMFAATATNFAPGNIVRSDDKRRARLNRICHLLSLIPYEKVPQEKARLPERSMKDAYDDLASPLFEDMGGIARYIQYERLLEACGPALSRDDTVDLPIAKDLCFADASSFSCTFRGEFGHSPCRVRSAASAGLATPRGGVRRQQKTLASCFADSSRARPVADDRRSKGEGKLTMARG